MDINMEDIVSAGDADYELVTFSWDIIDVCQYNCSYCSAMNFNLNTVKHKTHILQAWKNVVKLLSLKSIKVPFSVEILGGEPTLHPDIIDIVDALCVIDNCVQVDLITNLAKPLSFYQKFDKPCNEKLAIEASYHPEYCGDKYIQKVIDLNKSEFINVCPNINLPDVPEQWEKTRDLIDTFIDNDVNIGLNFLQAVPDGPVGGWEPNYTDEFWEYFKDYINPDEHCYVVEEKDNLSVRDKAVKFLNEHAGAITTNIQYKTKDGETHKLSEGDINRLDLRRFKGWTCRPLMYHITMDGVIRNHCTEEVIPAFMLNSKTLTACRECPLDRCDCDTKFLFEKHLPA